MKFVIDKKGDKKSMYLIIGLGNPEPEYSKTRHNMGFDVINKLSEEYGIEIKKQKFDSLYGTGIIKDEKVVLVKPQTYMNLSGEAVIQFANFYKVKPDNILIIYDDIDIETGIIKIRKKGSPGSHNGMKSVVHELGTTDFPRIRVGTGSTERIANLINYVISRVSDEEYKKLQIGIDKAVDAVKEILEFGIDNAMNRMN